ncbi:MAG: PD-(D/E)XK nuclease domain-containing protein [Bacteroides sp.]|nr:PD-(D/E)XK nuclease domain-containing protein [Bacteroides sp.]
MAGTLKQIEEKQYTRAYLTDSRTIIRIGVNFSSKTMTIEEWEETR